MHQPIDETDEMIEEMASPDGFYPTTHDVRTELVRLREENAALKLALSKAILDTSRAALRCREYDPAGSTYEVQWLCTVRRWAALCNLNLQDFDPSQYV